MDSNLYQQELKRPEWKAFREQVLEERGRECEKCGSKNHLEIHHTKYYRAHRPWEYDINDVMVLCSECHQLLHRRLGITIFQEGGKKIDELELCSHCKGDCRFPEYEHLLGGKCFKCLGCGREDVVHLSLDSIWALSGDVWDDWVENECGDKFKSRENVFFWLADMHGYKENDAEIYANGRND